MKRPPGREPKHMTVGSDGIAISHDGKHLYYCPLASRRLYRVRTDALLDEKASDEEVGEGGRGPGRPRLRLRRAGVRRQGPALPDRLRAQRHPAAAADGQYETLVHDPRVLWPDTLSLAADGYLYFTANQLHRQARFQGGKDLREKPYVLFRVKVDAGPVLLRREQ